MTAPFYLHWGQVSQTINVEGDVIRSKTQARVSKSSVISVRGRGKQKPVRGSGGSGPVVGRSKP